MATVSESVEPFYPVLQDNGQRIYFPDPKSPQPPRGTEIFVGNIPITIFESELIPLFSRPGPIYKLRIMMDFSGRTRGFCFICYHNREDALAAIDKFDKYPIRFGVFLNVSLSVDNRKLFLGNVPNHKTDVEIKEELGMMVDGIIQVVLQEVKSDNKINRGYGFIEFESHALAATARRKIANSSGLWGSRRVVVDWAHPEPMLEPTVLEQVKNLYFKNVPIKCTQECFRRFLCTVLDKDDIVRIFKRENYAFVHFKSKMAAEHALEKFQSEFLMIYGRQIEAEWARPPNYANKMRGHEKPDNFCMSVPPQIRRIIMEQKNERKKKQKNPSGSCDASCFAKRDEDIGHVENFLASRFHNICL